MINDINNIETKSAEQLMKEKGAKVLIPLDISALVILKPEIKNKVLSVFIETADCLCFVLDFGDKGTLYFHKFRYNNDTNIESSLFDVFEENNITIKDLKKISMLERDKDGYSGPSYNESQFLDCLKKVFTEQDREETSQQVSKSIPVEKKSFFSYFSCNKKKNITKVTPYNDISLNNEICEKINSTINSLINRHTVVSEQNPCLDETKNKVEYCDRIDLSMLKNLNFYKNCSKPNKIGRYNYDNVRYFGTIDKTKLKEIIEELQELKIQQQDMSNHIEDPKNSSQNIQMESKLSHYDH
jgi:hypothetical protein